MWSFAHSLKKKKTNKQLSATVLHIAQISIENITQYYAIYGFYHPGINLIIKIKTWNMLLYMKAKVERIQQVHSGDIAFCI